ncbi:MAG: pectinesterase family protein [Saprospiraceae bacterium]
MIKKIQLLMLPILFLCAIANAQSKIDVWDFAATQLDPSLYNNQLDETIINNWYDGSITVGSSGNVLPSNISAGDLSWTGGGNDRLRTINTNLTRYDQNIGGVTGYDGRIYVNSAANVTRFISLNLAEDDEVSLAVKTDSGGELNFEFSTDPAQQTDVVSLTSDLTELTFVAKSAGIYRFYDTQGKPSYFRISRKHANYVTITGSIDESEAAGIPANYSVVCTNAAGKSWSFDASNGSFTAVLPSGHSYELSLAGTNGYIITTGSSLDVDDNTTAHAIKVVKLDLFTVTGSILGLGNAINSLSLQFTPDPMANSIFTPEPVVNAGNGTYSVELEPNLEYTISAEGVNDYFIPGNTITIGAGNTMADINFAAKTLYHVTINTSGLDAMQSAGLNLGFSNLNEAGYAYSFSDVAAINLRDGTYSVEESGLDLYPVQLALTSNLTVAGADTDKNLRFVPVTDWDFDDKVINNGDPAYKGMLFTGQVSNEVAKGHLTAKNAATIQVPANVGETVKVTYYYSADFSFDGGTAITTNSQSTSLLEYAEYTYPGSAPGYVTITVGGSVSTSYFPNIKVIQHLPYAATITVGTNKDYQTINEALDAIRRMIRNDDDRVTILVDPGNYEEMLVIDEPNVTLKNAAVSPGIGLLNKGLDIEPNAVRVTSYYGHGYYYYSQGSDEKWDAEVLAVNKENGYHTNDNPGGTTNGSYWNATVVVMAEGFVAESIIFENSFNQYISSKEANDVVVEWPVGGKGPRPTVAGDTDVQEKSFVERAAAIGVANNTDKVILNKCRVIGRQDAFFGGTNTRVVMYKGSAMGAVDYIFGGMTAVFYKTELAMNISDASNDQSYITAAQQGSGRGYLMFECTVTSAKPGIENTSVNRAKPGYFGRPWLANTSEVVFYNTTIETTDYPGSEGKSLIVPLGWQNSLGGESPGMYEYNTTEFSGENNTGSRASWATQLNQPVLNDGTDITPFNFTKGNDGWDPLPGLISEDQVGTHQPFPETSVVAKAINHRVYISNVVSKTQVMVYDTNGRLLKSLESSSDFEFDISPNGIWFVHIMAADGLKTIKVHTN